MPATIGVALVGYGRMGRLYARILARQAPRARIAALVDPGLAADSPEIADVGVERVLGDAAKAFDLPDVDAVVIATPTSTHAALVIAAAEAGKPVFCEKPLALSLEETDAALRAVERHGTLLQVGLMRRFDAAYRRLADLVESGAIGRPLVYKSVGRDPACPRAEFANPALSGGIIVDMGIHDFDAARWLMHSEVERVSAEGSLLVCEDLRAIGDLDNAMVNLRFANGGLGNVEVSRTAFYGYDIRAEILGSEGAATLGTYQQTPVLLLTRSGAQHDVVPSLMDRFGDAYAAQIDHFLDCVRHDRPPIVGGKDARAAFEIALAATRACQSGQSVSLADLQAGESL